MKTRITSILLALLVMATFALPLSGCSGESIDYIASVKAMQPFKSSGDTTTYGTVLNKYVASCTWEENTESNELTYVVASGKLTASGNQETFTITFTVKPGASDDLLSIKINSGFLAGEAVSKGEMEELMVAMFDAYAEDFDNLDDYFDYYG